MNCALGRAQAPAGGSSASAETHVGKGYEYVKDERFAAAAQEFQAALQIEPALRRARYQLAVCYFALGRRDDARRDFERLRREAPDPKVTYYLGRFDLVEHQPERDIRELGSIAAHAPFPDTAYYLGAAYLEKGDLTSATRWLQQAEALTPGDFRVPDHLARVDQRLDLASQAEKEYARSAELRQYYDQATTTAVECTRDLERDQLPQALRSLYNDFAISYYPDVNAFTEWVPTLGIGGGPFYKTSDEAAFLTWLRLALVRESGDRLYLDSGAPRAWFLPGRTIEVEHAATFFGEASFRMESHIDQGFIEATVSTPPAQSSPRHHSANTPSARPAHHPS